MCGHYGCAHKLGKVTEVIPTNRWRWRDHLKLASASKGGLNRLNCAFMTAHCS